MKRKKLSYFLFGKILIVLVPFLLLEVIFLHSVQTYHWKSHYNVLLRNLSFNLAYEINRWMDGTLLYIKIMKKMLQDVKEEDICRALRRMRHMREEFLAYYLVDENWKIKCIHPKLSKYKGLSLKYFKELRRAKEREITVISTPYVSFFRGELTIAIITPLGKNVLIVELDFNNVVQIMRSFVRPQRYVDYMIITDQGDLLVHSKVQIRKRKENFALLIDNWGKVRKEGGFFEFKYGGKTYLASASVITPLNWLAVAAIPKSYILSVIYKVDGLIFFIALGFLAAFGVLLYFALRKAIERPLAYISQETAKIAVNRGRSRLNEHAVPPVVELAELIKAINRMASDIEEHIKKLESSERKLKVIFESVDSALLLLDSSLRIIKFNQAASSLFPGLGEGRSLKEVFPPHVATEIEKRLSEPLPSTFEAVMGEEGEEVYLEISLYSTGEQESNYVILVKDITEKKTEEKREIQRQKLESMGHMAASFAHDFNNLLAVIVGNLDLMLMENDTSRLGEYIDAIRKATQEAADLVRKVLSFTKRAAYVTQRLPVSLLMKEAINRVEGNMKGRVRLEVSWPDHELYITGDRPYLVQALTHILTNAFEAVEKSPDPAVRFSVRPLKIGKESYRLGLKPGDYVAFQIADNGCGVAEDMREKIFDPFVTTKSRAQDKAVGLGLTVALNIVRGHGGTITHRREKGWTIFEVLLPQAKR